MRTITSIYHIYPPGSPLDTFLNDPKTKPFKDGLETALRDTQFWIFELWLEKEAGDWNKLIELTSNIQTPEPVKGPNEVPKPPKPLLMLSGVQIAEYHTSLLKEKESPKDDSGQN